MPDTAMSGSEGQGEGQGASAEADQAGQAAPRAATAFRPSGDHPSRMTPRAREFVAVNRVWRVISGEWLDKDRRKVTGPPETWVKLRYRFANGQQLTLNEADMASMKARGVEPLWVGDRDSDRHPQGGNAVPSRSDESAAIAQTPSGEP